MCRPVPQRDRGDRRHHPSGVRDGIKRGEQILQEMEDKLQFAARFNALRENYSAIASTLQSIQTQTADQPQVQTACREAMEAVHHGLELL